MIRILIADDHQLLVDLLKSDLESNLDIQVVATAENGEEVVRLAKELRPDVILMDIQMPVCDGIEATRQIKKWNSTTNILVLTSDADNSQIQHAIKAGADGYVLKSISIEELVLAIQSVHANMRVMSKNVDEVGRTYWESDAFSIESGAVVCIEGMSVHLTKKELGLLTLVVKGKNLAEMATTLKLKEGTVQNQITALKKKLQLRDKNQLALFAVKHRLVEP